jgi:hypothetical protein
MKPQRDTKPGNYYVTIHDGARFGFLAGPFKDGHAVRSSPHFRGGVNRPAPVDSAAIDLVARCQELAIRLNPWAHFYAFGTARIDYDYDEPGKLNARLGLAAARSDRRATHEGRRESARLYYASTREGSETHNAVSAETTHTEKGGTP